MFEKTGRGGRASAIAGIAVLAVAITCGTAAAQSRIVFSAYSCGTNPDFLPSCLFTIGSDGRGLRQVTRNNLDFGPSWSPHHRRIVFEESAGPLGGTGLIVMVNANGSHRHVINDSGVNPDWAPKGDRIVFTHENDVTGKTAIFTMRPNGRDVRRLTRDGHWSTPAWSPNGKLIAYAGRTWLFTMHADGSHKRKLIWGARFPDWSPDGQHIAFQRDGNVYLALAAGQNVRRVTGGARGGQLPSWSPGGSRIAFAGDKSGPFSGDDSGIWTMDREGHDALQLTKTGSGPDW